MTVVDWKRLEEAVEQLPPWAIAQLRHGPIEYDGCCRICDVADALWHRQNAGMDVLDEFHAGPPRENPRGGEGLEAYLRCIVVYMAAGWDGQPR